MSRHEFPRQCVRCDRRNMGKPVAARYASVPFAWIYCERCARIRLAERAADTSIVQGVIVAQGGAL